MNKVLNLTYELARRGQLTNILLDVIYDEQTPAQERTACMRIWYRAADHGKWDRKEIETVLAPIIERRLRVPEQKAIPSPGRPVLVVENKDKKRHS